VVLVLIALIAGVTSISTRPDPHQILADQARRVGLQIRVATDAARLKQQTITWEGGLKNYRFVAADDQGAGEVTITSDELLRERQWDVPLTRLSITDLGTGTTRTLVDPDAPPLRIRAGREWIQPRWKLDLVAEEASVSIEFDALGQAKVAHAN
jgi:type II secretory pathway pseudopilin PulG